MDRRSALKWMLAAAAPLPAWQPASGAAPLSSQITVYVPVAHGYGTDPNLQRVYKPGELWPLTFTPAQRRLAEALSDLIIPADAYSPSASQAGVIDFLDEWVSAPYAVHRQDRRIVLDGFEWLDAESTRRFARPFARLMDAQQRAICDDICYLPKAKPQLVTAAKFFARYRDLTAGGFYTTPEGRMDLQYVGNAPMATFEGPPLEVLKRVGLGSDHRLSQ